MGIIMSSGGGQKKIVWLSGIPNTKTFLVG